MGAKNGDLSLPSVSKIGLTLVTGSRYMAGSLSRVSRDLRALSTLLLLTPRTPFLNAD